LNDVTLNLNGNDSSPYPSQRTQVSLYIYMNVLKSVAIVVRFWHSSRSRHVSKYLEATLLYQWAQLSYKSDMDPRGKARVSLRANI